MRSVRAVIVGGGKLGSELTDRLLDRHGAVIVIERSERRARALSDKSKALVLVGDGTDMRRLSSLELRTSDVFIAVTGRDEDNLVACQLATTAFGVRRVLARMNNPRNRQAFRALGVPTVNVTDEMTLMIERSLELVDHVSQALPDRGELVTVELTVGSSFEARPLNEIGLPPSTVVVTVTRGDLTEVPDASTEIRAGDHLLVVTRREVTAPLDGVFGNQAAIG